MRAQKTLVSLAPLLLAALPGCWGHSPDAGSGSGDLENLIATVNAVVPTVLNVTWDAPVNGASHVEYGLDGVLDQTTPTVPSGTHFDMNLFGMKAGRTYSYQAVTVTEDGEELRSDVRTVDVAIQPQGLPAFALDPTQLDPTQMMDEGGGYVLLSIMQLSDSWVAIVDRDGDYVWFMEADDGLNIPTSHASPEGDAIFYTQNDRMQVSDLGGIMRVTLDGLRTLTDSPAGHHDAIQVPGEDTIDYVNVETDTWDVEGRGDTLVAFDNIWEAPIGNVDPANATRIWSLSDRLSDYGRDPWVVCSHFNAEAYSTGGKDWTHSNSIMSSDDGQYLYFMSKNLDALWKIDRAAHTHVWQMGGEDSDFTFSDYDGPFADSPDHWSHGHMSDITEDRLCVFDNGYHHDTDSEGGGTRSRVIEYSYDESTMQVTKTWEKWIYDEQGTPYFNPELGDCRRLANGNHIVSVTVASYVFEANDAGDIVWRIYADQAGLTVGRVTYLHDLYTLAQE